MVEKTRRRLEGLVDRWRPLATGLGLVLAANVLLHVFVLREMVRVSGDREEILAAERARFAAAAAETAALERTASKLACTRSDVDHVFDDVLSSKQERMTAIQRELRQLARDNRLDPDRLSYTVSDLGGTGLVQFGASFPLEGPYDLLQKFIQQVEASKNFLIVSDISLTGDQAQGGNLRLQVKVATYFLAPDIEALRAAFPTVGRKA